MWSDYYYYYWFSKWVVVFFVVVLLNYYLMSCHSHVEAAAGFPVKFLPGFDGPLPFHLETGYIGVGDNEEIQLFYYFIKSDSNPQEDPLILWITGGPGCSPLRAILQEIGPMLIEPVEYNGSLLRLLPFPYSWTKRASFIFLDLPVGTGYSYATTSTGVQTDNLLTGSNGYEFLQKWLVDHHPEFISNPFYVGGDSYSGITVPILTEMISNGIERGDKPLIQLKGYMVGNGVTFLDEQNYKIPFAHGMGLISDELYESLKKNCKGDYYVNIDSANLLCQQNLQTFNQVRVVVRGQIKLTERIYDKYILEPICLSDDDSSKTPLFMLSEQIRYLSQKYKKLLSNPDLLPALKCRGDWENLLEYWANDYHVQKALHVREGTIEKWERCASNLPFTKIINNTIPYHMKLGNKGYRSLIYSGDHDFVVTYISTQAWIKSLNYSIVDDWRPWTVEGQVAGYTRTYANQMTFATVKAAGHTAPEYRPSECLSMFQRWVSYKDL